MQAHQGLNGTYKLPAFTERTLSEDDRSRVLSLYGSTEGMKEGMSAIEGKLTNSSLGDYPVPLQGAHVWVEESSSGRVVASGTTSANGNYRIESIPAGYYRVLTEYLDGATTMEGSPGSLATSLANPGNTSNLTRGQRPFRSVELRNRVRLRADATTRINFVMVPPHGEPPSLSPRLLGANGIFRQRLCPQKPARN